MSGLSFKVQLRLLGTEEGGRTLPIRSGYRPSWDLTDVNLGRSTVEEARVSFDVPGEKVAPGAVTEARLEPATETPWGRVGPGVTLAMREGSRVVGHALVIEVTSFGAAATEFASLARAFCAFVEKAPDLPEAARSAELRERFARLYHAGLGLPPIEPPAERVAPPRTSLAPERRPPIAGPSEPGLLDVVETVDRTLREGMILWDAGAHAAAVGVWRHGFARHVGEDMLAALRALHRACAEPRATTPVP